MYHCVKMNKILIPTVVLIISVTYGNCQVNQTLLFHEEMPANSPSTYEKKYLSVYKQSPGDETWVNIRSVIQINDINKANVKEEVGDSLKLTPSEFQSVYLCLSSKDDTCSTGTGDRRRWTNVIKFYEGTTPFHVIIRKNYFIGNATFVYRGINMDSSEYKFLLSVSSEVMKRSGL